MIDTDFCTVCNEDVCNCYDEICCFDPRYTGLPNTCRCSEFQSEMNFDNLKIKDLVFERLGFTLEEFKDVPSCSYQYLDLKNGIRISFTEDEGFAFASSFHSHIFIKLANEQELEEFISMLLLNKVSISFLKFKRWIKNQVQNIKNKFFDTDDLPF